MQECLALAKSGVPWDVIMGLDDTERRGMCIAAGILDGGEYDWQEGKWIKPDA